MGGGLLTRRTRLMRRAIFFGGGAFFSGGGAFFSGGGGGSFFFFGGGGSSILRCVMVLTRFLGRGSRRSTDNRSPASTAWAAIETTIHICQGRRDAEGSGDTVFVRRGYLSGLSTLMANL